MSRKEEEEDKFTSTFLLVLPNIFSSGTTQARSGLWIFNNLPEDFTYFHLLIYFLACYR